jgi:hypothetical protein
MSSPAEVRLAQVAAFQHGVFGRAQALAAGLTKSQLDRRLQDRRWVRVLPRVYRDAATASSLVAPFWAAVLWSGPGSALSHRSAALLWRIEPAMRGPIEVAVPAARAPRANGIVVHRADTDRDVILVEGLPLTSPCRTLIDLAGIVDDAELGVALASALLHGLVTVPALLGRLDELGSAGRAGSARVRRVAAAIDANEAANLEAGVAHLLRAHRLHAPERDRGRFAWPDARLVLKCAPPGMARLEPGWRVLTLAHDDLARPDELVARVVRALDVPRFGASRERETGR